MLGRGCGSWRHSCTPGGALGRVWEGFVGCWCPAHVLVLVAVAELLAGAALVVQWLGRISPLGRARWDHGPWPEPGARSGCSEVQMWRGGGAGACSHPHGSQQLAGGGWARAPAFPWNVSWKSSMLLAWREGGMVRGKEE